MKKIFALVFSLIILEQNSEARYRFDEENEDFNSWSSPRDSWNDDEDDYRSSSRKTSSWDDDDDYRSSSRKTSSWDDDDDYRSSSRKTSYWDDDDDYRSSSRKTSSWGDDDEYRSSSRQTSSWDDDDDYRSSSRKTSSWDDDDDYRPSSRKTSSWDDDDYRSSSRKTSSWDDDDDYRSSSRKTSSWDDDDYGSSYRKTSSWDDDDYRSSYRKTSSWDDDDDLSYKTRYSYYDDDDDDLINPRSAKEQREIEEKREQRKKEKQLRKKQGKQKKREKALTNRRDQAAIDRIILDETPEDEKFDLLKDQLKLANTRMERYVSKLKKKFTDPNLDFIERSFKFNNDSVGVLLENSRPEAKWKGKFLKENPEFNENDERTEEQITNEALETSDQSDELLGDSEQTTNEKKIDRMTQEECQQRVKDGLIDKEYFFQLSLDNTKKINKAVKSIIKAVENRNGKTSQINKRKSMENAPKLRMLVALNSNLFKDVEFVRSIKNQLKVLGESIRESYEIASENGKKDHPYLKFLIVDKI